MCSRLIYDRGLNRAGLVPPHGEKLLPLLLHEEELKYNYLKAKKLPRVRLTSREASDLIMLAMGAFSPLKGFVNYEDYRSVVHDMQLQDGLLWPIPITLSVSKEEGKALRVGQEIALVEDKTRDILGMMTVEEKYPYDKKDEAKNVFQTNDENHPGVKQIFHQGEVYLGGSVRALSEGNYPEKFSEFARPKETRKIFTDLGWKTVAAFQTRNPMHRSHEYLTKIAMEICDGIFIHPIVGSLKTDDIPAEIRMKCYHALIHNYYPKDQVVLKVYPMEMRYAGPREAILHAIIRQNFGCSHLIVGRDRAGVGNYYGPFDAQYIFDELKPNVLYIKPLRLDWTFWCYKCGGMASTKTCPHTLQDHCIISGTELRKMLSQGKKPPAESSRPEVLQILTDYYKNKRKY